MRRILREESGIKRSALHKRMQNFQMGRVTYKQVANRAELGLFLQLIFMHQR